MSPAGENGASRGKKPPRVRPQLDVATIMDAALRLSAGGNPEPLTVRSLGKELGADPTAIYRHFRDKDELVLAVLDRLISEGLEAVDLSADWRTRMTQMADSTLRTFQTYPSIGGGAGSQTTGGPGELAAIEMILVAMGEAGLDPQDSVRFYGVLSSYVISFAAAQAGAVLVGNRDSDPAWIGFTRSLHQSRHPTITGGPRRARCPARPRHLRVRGAGHPRRRRGPRRGLRLIGLAASRWVVATDRAINGTRSARLGSAPGSRPSAVGEEGRSPVSKPPHLRAVG